MKKGFTLIELLAVIVILAIIALIAVPMILGVIATVKKGAATSSALGYVDAVEKAVLISMLDGVILSGEYNVDTLKDKISLKGTTPTKGSITVDTKGNVTTATLCINNYKVSHNGNIATITANNCDDMAEVVTLYKDNILNGADPILGNNMIPVTIANDGTVTYANIKTKWYDYTNKEWANAIKLVTGSTYKVGDIIPESSIESYFVWIPRYKYKIFNNGIYTTTISGMPTSSAKQTIDVVFESKNETASIGNIVDSYLTHPAFTSLDENGIWVGKYETGYKGATSTTIAQVTSTDSTKIVVKPNLYSWRNNTVYNMFVSSYNYDRINDSHMMKNTEWGAVAYLSHSVYGINKEININNNSSFRTGYSALITTNQTTYPGEYGTDSSKTLSYNTGTGYLASTTGNISGIYDMSGGAWEYLAAYMSGQFGSSGFTITTISNANYDKYLDVYSSSSTVTSFNNRILGDATGEMGSFYSYVDGDGNTRQHNNWYSELSYFVASSNPWFRRGGSFNNGVLAGQFFFSGSAGEANTYIGSRLVLSN